MTLGNLSYLAMVTAAMLYLLAMIAHSLEWASSGKLSAEKPADGSEDDARLRADGYGRMGISLTVLGALSQTVAVVTRGIAADRLPWGNMYEFSTTALLIIAWGYLLLVWRFGLRWLGIFVTGLLTVGVGLAVTAFYVEIAPLVPALHSVWFIVHIVTACIAGAAFNIGGIASIVYLLRLSREPRREVGTTGSRLPGAVEARPDRPVGASHDRVRLPRLDLHGGRGRCLGRVRLGTVLELGPERDLVVGDLGDLCHVPTRQGHCWLAGTQRGVHLGHWAGVLLVQLHRRKPADERSSLLRWCVI